MDTTLTKKVSQLLALDDMTEAQQLMVCERIGEQALDTALSRLLLSVSPEEVAAIELYLDTHTETADVFECLNNTYPAFETFIEEEITALQLEIVSVMSW